jgi:hypothetical protein
MAGTLTVTGDQRALDWLFTTGSPTRAATWFLSLHVGANGGAGASNEIVGNGYARQAVTFTRSAQTMSNTAVITVGPNTTANWGTVTDLCIFDLVTAGTCLAQGTASTSVAYNIGDSATIAIGALTITNT